MANLLYAELLKLKNSKMFLISLIGSAVAPFMCFLAFLNGKPDEQILFKEVFSNTNTNIILLIGVLLYGVITSYLFNREYTENTLKSILTIPVSRIGLIISKLILLFCWMMVLTIVSWVLTLLLGLIGQFEGLNTTLLVNSFLDFLNVGCLLFLLSTPVTFVSLLFKNFVPTIVFTIAITMGNMLIVNSEEYIAIYPWSAIFVITNNIKIPEYPLVYSYLSIFVTFILGLIAAVVYFKKVDIH